MDDAFEELIDEFDADSLASGPSPPAPLMSAPQLRMGTNQKYASSQELPRRAAPKPTSLQLAKKEEERQRILELRSEIIMARKARNLAIAKECARRRAWPNERTGPPPPPEDEGIAAELQSRQLDFLRWDCLFYAYQADQPCVQTRSIEEEADVALAQTALSEDLLLNFLSFILKGTDPAPILVSMIPSLSNRNDTYAHEFSAVTGAVGIVFQTMMGRLLDRAAQMSGPNEVSLETWRTLLSAARQEVSSFVALMSSMVLHRIPMLSKIRVEGIPGRVIVHRAVEESLGDLVEVALPLFYHQCYQAQDEAVHAACIADVIGVSRRMNAEVEPDPVLVLLKRALEFDRPSPFVRLRLVIQAVRLLSTSAAGVVGSDELLPLFVSRVASLRPIRLASRVKLFQDMLPHELSAGEDAFAVALLQSAVAALGGDSND